jgi:hypothetical protein
MGEIRDVVILLPGITGSTLEKNGKELWGASGGAVWRAIRSLGGSLEELELPASGDPGGVTAGRLIPDVTIVPGLVKIDGYSAIEDFLINDLGLTPGKNYFPFPYDWRLDNRVNAQRLQSFAIDRLKKWRSAPANSGARLVLVGHSMGGLISRYFLECLGGWRETRTLITVGTPHRGSLNAVDFLVNGMKKGVGPLGVDLGPMLRSLPSLYQLLPNYPCVDIGAASELAGVADAVARGMLPNIDEQRARDALRFHREIVEAQEANNRDEEYRERGYVLRPVVGVEQPTTQSVRCRNSAVELLRSLSGDDTGGDGTVPRISAVPFELFQKNVEIFAAEKHGSLQNLDGVLTNVKGILTQPDIKPPRLLHGGLRTDLSLDVDDVALPGQPLVVRVRATEGSPELRVKLTNTQRPADAVDDRVRAPSTEWKEMQYDLEPGVWRVTIGADDANPVTDLAVVAAP